MRLSDPQGWRILLSHHAEDELHLCIPVRTGQRLWYVCARCLGLYPAFFATWLIGQHTPPWPVGLEMALLFLAPLPALLDWGTTVASGRPARSRQVRFWSGVGLGVALGANLAVNAHELLSVSVRAQILFLAGSIWVVWLVSYLRRLRFRMLNPRPRDARKRLEDILINRDKR